MPHRREKNKAWWEGRRSPAVEYGVDDDFEDVGGRGGRRGSLRV